MVLPHVNHLAGFAHSLKSGLYHGFWFAHEGHDRAVGGFARIDVQQSYSFYFFYFRGDLSDDFGIAPLTEVGHALHYTFSDRHSKVFIGSKSSANILLLHKKCKFF